MKKAIAFLLALSMCFICTAGMAAGKLNVAQENFHVVEGTWSYGYVYAKVENVGDKPIKINAGVLEIYDGDGAAITSTDYMSAYAAYLEPGVYTYIKMSDEIEGEGKAAKVADHMLTVTGKSDNTDKTVRLASSNMLKMNVEDGWWTHNYMYATVTNSLDTPAYGINTVFALLDAEGNILYMDDDSLYSERALMPGSSMIIRKDISSSFIDYFTAKGLTPAALDVIAYIDVDVD